MFIERHTTTTTGNTYLAFLKSANVQAFPCGRRRSEAVNRDRDGNGSVGDNEIYYIPFDPESRLNTEANNRKHASINGFSQSFIKNWENGEGTDNVFSIVLGGYAFTIKLTDSNFMTPNSFGSSLISFFKSDIGSIRLTEEEQAAFDDAEYIYANILVENTPLFEGFMSYKTGILRNQTDDDASVTIDMLNSVDRNGTQAALKGENFENYYFSGLSFSTEPLAELKTNSFGETYILDPVTGVVSQQLITLRILNKVSTTTDGGGLQTEWQLWQPAFLPKIEHGDEEHSIVLEHVTANHVELVSPTDASVSLGVVPAVATPESPDSAGTYRLTFTFGQKKAVESPENPEEPV